MLKGFLEYDANKKIYIQISLTKYTSLNLSGERAGRGRLKRLSGSVKRACPVHAAEKHEYKIDWGLTTKTPSRVQLEMDSSHL